MNKTRITSAVLTCAILFGLAATAPATTRYWDSDGNTNAGLGVAGTFDWLTNTPWTTDPNGTAGTITAWVSSSDVAVFNGNGVATSTVSANVTTAGFNIVNSPGGAINATVNLSGAGSVTSTGAIYVGDYYGPGGSSATLNLYNTLVYSGTGGVVYIGGTGSSGTVNLIGPNAYLGGYAVDIGVNGSSGTANVTGGTLNSFGNPYISRSGTGTLNVSGTGLVQFNSTIICDTVGFSGTINLNGGRMVLGQLSKGVTGANTLAIINFNGGVLAGSKSASPWIPTNIDQLNVLSGGAIIDSVTFGVYIFAPLVTGVTGGPDGGLTKLSSGALTLYGTNTYTGPTIISNGTLVLSIPAGLSSSIPNSDQITVSPGAVFNVTGVNGNGFVLGSGQTLSGGGGVTGGVTVANSSTAIVHPGGGGTNTNTLTFSYKLVFAGSSAVAMFDLSSTASGANDKVVAATYPYLTCGGAQISINCGSVLDTNDYTLFDVGASGSISGSFNPTPVWAGTVPNYASGYSIVKGTRYVTLHFTHGPPVPGAFALGAVEGVPTSVTVAKIVSVSSNSNPGGSLSIASVTSPTTNGATVTVGGGLLTYTPVANLNPDTIQYVLTDGSLTTPATIAVTVSPNGTGNNGLTMTALGNNVLIQAFGIPGTSYYIQQTSSLNYPVTWVDLPGTPVTASPLGQISYTVTNATSPSFYRTSTTP